VPGPLQGNVGADGRHHARAIGIGIWSAVDGFEQLGVDAVVDDADRLGIGSEVGDGAVFGRLGDGQDVGSS